MSQTDPATSTRRDFLTGRAARDTARDAAEHASEALAEQMTADSPVRPVGGDTIRLSTRSMACEFAVIMNPGSRDQVPIASSTLDLLHALEDQMSVYRPNSEMSRLNRQAAHQPVTVERELFGLLEQSRQLCRDTWGAFDPTSGPLIELWRDCRRAGRVPTEVEIGQCRLRIGIEHVHFDPAASAVRFDRDGVDLNLGGIGKGHALDRCGTFLTDNGLDTWLLHGGRSSLLARGEHNGQAGWPVGIGNPLFTKARLGTVLLRNQAMSTSGSNIQYFRHAGRRYGHIIDPRTGQPADGLLSVTVLAPTAAVADALSTAFFVLGVEKTREYCDNCRQVSALLIPPPRRGRTLEPVLCGFPEGVLFLNDEGLQTE